MLKTDFKTEIKQMTEGNLEAVSDYTKELVYQAKVMERLHMTWQDVQSMHPEKIYNFYLFVTALEEQERKATQ